MITPDTIVAIASLAVSIVATLIAKSSLARSEESIKQAQRVADRDQQDWKQRKWFDLYLKANEAYDALENFQTQYGYMPLLTSESWKQDFNSLMYTFRAIHALAMVFPMHPIVTELCLATGDCQNHADAISKDRLARLFDAMDKVREKAYVDAAVID